MSEKESQSLSPFEIILNAFVYFKASEMDEASLIKVCMATNCPNEKIVKAVLGQMVSRGLLTIKTTTEGLVMYAPVRQSNMSHRLN